MKVAIIHYWLVGMRGGEKVLEAICDLYPQADIFTHVAIRENLSEKLRRHRIFETFIARLPMARRMYQSYLPLMPRALEAIDLTGYDLILSTEAGPAKGVIAPPDAPHICYVHSPMRYLWDQYHAYREGAGSLARLAMPVFAPGLRSWDVTSAARVDHFLANSNHVANRVRKYWRREADVVFPPCDVAAFSPRKQGGHEEFYLWCGELAPYKRPDIAIGAFERLGLPLKVIGGPEKAKGKFAAAAASNIEFLGKVDFDVLRDHLARCKALIFPGEEDFGIVPVEAQASGRPVIAYARGGALDTVKHGETGWLFDDQSIDGLVEAVRGFEAEGLAGLNPGTLHEHAANFGVKQFQEGFRRAVEEQLAR
ncbi:glycosyltransferase [Leisingera aquaemixtae]|uniref:glycosyltransferase n=1 Tax=Leisingera aquaemixtae TaxID=1396826 RepID=UPI001C967E68|nr:glycosyltransferase [Leisingera aquaemixtae]MBY6069066.1 glycosyltransferase [Leisingera aquaemixtae]